MFTVIRPPTFNNLVKCLVSGTAIGGRQVHIERKVNVSGTHINIVQSGRGDQSLLLMPGTLGSVWTDFRPQIEKLPQLLPNYTIIAWDPPGYGKSIPPKKQFDMDCFRNDALSAVELMRSLDRPKFSILGWSGGGITALIMAGRFVDNIDKLVVWGAGAYITTEEIDGWKEMRDVKKWSPRMREPMEQVYGKERFPELWSEWIDTLVAIGSQRNGDFCRQEVESIKAPTFILRGKKDPVIAAEPVTYLTKRLKGSKYYEFPEGKHNIHLRYADEFNKLVADFLMAK